MHSAGRRSIQKLLLLIFTPALVLAGLPGCADPEIQYSRDTPEEAIASARQMLEDGNAERLVELLPAPSEDTRIVYLASQRMLGSLERLAATIEEAYPKEIAELRADAEAAAMRGDAIANIQRALTGSGRRRSGNGDSDDRLNALIKSLLADPYGFLRESEEKLTTQYIYDGTHAVLWDGKPILPPVGLVMQEDARDGTWHVVLPTNLPMVGQYLPKTADEYKIWAQILVVLSNACNDLSDEIERGEHASLEGVAGAAGEKVIAPMGMVFFAYQRVVRQRLGDD